MPEYPQRPAHCNRFSDQVFEAGGVERGGSLPLPTPRPSGVFGAQPPKETFTYDRAKKLKISRKVLRTAIRYLVTLVLNQSVHCRAPAISTWPQDSTLSLRCHDRPTFSIFVSKTARNSDAWIQIFRTSEFQNLQFSFSLFVSKTATTNLYIELSTVETQRSSKRSCLFILIDHAVFFFAHSQVMMDAENWIASPQAYLNSKGALANVAGVWDRCEW